ncbi:PH domain-containing protein [Listeria grandensis]|uniref:PH domain-containing protein n=1 Tax=Listeria grandensis TaxID=1494963 RepID=A0A7X0Y5Y8_9LIST|nr:PH domain-containing protein [Listeria grandensis]MBC1937144.1 PH domain-containing protein [Listeria grandensis]
MKFCPDCGASVEGMKFCPECGANLAKQNTPVPTQTQEATQERELISFSTYMFGLESTKASIMKNVNVSIPKVEYTLTTERLLIQKSGVLSQKKDELELYKVKDISVKQGMKDKMLGVGDITILSTDESSPETVLKRIHKPQDIKEQIRSAVQAVKKEMGIGYRQEI